MNDRKHLSGREFEQLLEAVKGSRNETRVRYLVLLMGGLSTNHPLRGDKIRAIKAWLVERARMKAPGRWFFLSEQRKPLHCSTVNLLLPMYGEKARLPVVVHPHMLRHAYGFALAEQGADTRLIQDYLGHRNIQHTVRYTATHRHQPGTV
jgi:type 1 fimbriae regulatory protein FimB